MDIQPNVTKLTVMETHWSCCFKGLDTDGLHHSAQFPLSWVLFSCSKVSSVYFGVHLRDCAKQHTGIHCICQRTRRPMQTFPRQEERSSKFHGLFWQETDLRVGGYIKTRRKLVSLIKRGVCVKSLACNAYIMSVCAESFIAALYSPFWSPRNVFLLHFFLQRSRDLMKTTLSLTGPLGGPMNG